MQNIALSTGGLNIHWDTRTDDMSELAVAIDRILGIIVIAEEMLTFLEYITASPWKRQWSRKQFL